MFTYSLAIVSAFIVGRTVRDALFLSKYSVERLPLMYVGVAVCVASFSLVYGRYADRFRRDHLILSTLLVSGLLVVIGWVGLSFFPAPFMYPALYVFVEIVGVVTIVQFWTFANDLMSSREGKRLFGIVGAGGVLSNVVCGFPLGAVAARVHSEHLLLFIVALFGLAAWMVRKLSVDAKAELESRPRSMRPMTKRGGPFLGSPHLSLIAGIVLVTVLTTTFIDYQLKVAAREAFAGRSTELASFFGYFYGFTGVLSCFVQFFVTTRLLERYGVVVALFVLPTALAFGSVGLLLVPLVPGLTAASLAKGSEHVLRYTVNDSTMQLLYNPVPSDQRGRAKSFIDGVLKPSGIGVAGIAILFMSQSMRPETFSLSLAALDLVFALGWLVMVVAMRHRYVSSLLETLRSRRLEPAAPLDDEGALSVLGAALSSADDSEVLHALELIPAVSRDRARLVRPLVAHGSPEVRLRAMQLLARFGNARDAELTRSRFGDEDARVRRAAVEAHAALARGGILAGRALLSDPSLDVRAATVAGLLKHGGAEGRVVATPALSSMISSADGAERRAAALVLGELDRSEQSDREALGKLASDTDVSVRRAAIEAVGNLGAIDLLPKVIDALGSLETSRVCRQALMRFGPGAEGALLIGLASSGVSVRRELLRALSRVGGTATVKALAEAALASDEGTRSAAVNSLAELVAVRPHLRLSADELMRALKHISALAERDAEALVRLRLDAEDLLRFTLDERRHRHVAHAFRLLEARYPKRGLGLAHANLESPEKTKRANALEVVENVLDGEEARLLMPLLEEIAGTVPAGPARVAKGLASLGLPEMTPSDMKSALLSDRSAWVRSVAIRSLFKTDPELVREALPVLLEDRDPLVEETLLAALAEFPNPRVLDSAPVRVLIRRAEASPSAFVQEAGRALSTALS